MLGEHNVLLTEVPSAIFAYATQRAQRRRREPWYADRRQHAVAVRQWSASISSAAMPVGYDNRFEILVTASMTRAILVAARPFSETPSSIE